MAPARVGSREYKAMLAASRFAGDESQVLAAARAFWRDWSVAVGPAVLATAGDLNAVKDRRRIRFFDTGNQHLNRHAYIFRERAAQDGSAREVTLKFRHPDRFIARNRDMRASTKHKTKFEEDIKPPFQTLYSYSTTASVPVDQKIETLRDVRRIFPGLKQDLPGFSPADPLALVNGFTAREVVIGGGSLHLGKKFDVSAGCVLVIWYDNDKPGDPVVAEFSFKYGDNREAYGGGTVRRAYEAFAVLRSSLNGWTDNESKTKTAFVYG